MVLPSAVPHTEKVEGTHRRDDFRHVKCSHFLNKTPLTVHFLSPKVGLLAVFNQPYADSVNILKISVIKKWSLHRYVVMGYK